MKRYCLHGFDMDRPNVHGHIFMIFDAKTKKDAIKIARASFGYDGKISNMMLSELSWVNMFFSKNLNIIGPCDHPKFELLAGNYLRAG